jgi:large subunit ribosomal protein L6
MSKVGKKQINIPDGISVEVREREIMVTGKNGMMTIPTLEGIRARLEEKNLSFEAMRNSKQVRSNWGTMRALVANAIQGLTSGFEKTLILEGVGFRVMKEGEGLALSLGFSHPVKYPEVPGIVFEIEKNSILRIKGFDKGLVGKIAADIRAMKKVEPYKGKGFRYSDEIVRRKAGKKSVGSS